jgi:hypothetical protein
LATLLALQLTLTKAVAGPAGQAGQAVPASGAAPSAASSQAARSAPSAAGQQNAVSNRGPAQDPAAANAGVTLVDNGRVLLGGKVFSTGTDDILLTVPSPSGLPYPEESITTVVNGQRVRVPNPNVSAFVNSIAILAPGAPHVVASNRQHGRTINLGKFPAGEIIFGIQTSQGLLFQTGDGSRNPDHVPHSITKTYLSGVIEVWFEDQPGSRLPATDRDFNDAVFQLRGGVADNNAVAEFTKIIREQQGEARQQAINALRQINPKALDLALGPTTGGLAAGR